MITIPSQGKSNLPPRSLAVAAAVLWTSCTLGSLALAAEAPEAPREPSTQQTCVLFIGNSYTYFHDGLGAQISRLAEAAGQPPLSWQLQAPGGFTFEHHLEREETLQAIQEGWDFVVLQEQSQRPIVAPRLFLESGLRLDAAVDAVDAQSVLFLTWARSYAPETQPALTAAYCTLATQADAEVVPAGEVWQEVRQAHPELDLYESDGSHPNPAGVYLNALLFYRLFYGGTPPPPEVAAPAGVSVDVATKLYAATGSDARCPQGAAGDGASRALRLP